MERKSVLERVKPEIKEYIMNLAKAEEELYKKCILFNRTPVKS